MQAKPTSDQRKGVTNIGPISTRWAVFELGLLLGTGRLAETNVSDAFLKRE
jgi:hypothetical protein